LAWILLISSGGPIARTEAAEPPALNPFSKAGDAITQQREDAVPGYIEMSDGTIYCGHIYLTRDKRLKIYDPTVERQREIPLSAVKEIECRVAKEWMEREWRPKETANSEILYTGRTYPSRKYTFVLTLKDDRRIEGMLAGIVYIAPDAQPPKPGQPQEDPEELSFVLHDRDKGKIGETLKSLKYLKRIKLGEDACKEGQRKASIRRPSSTKR
jgi:hypothetical protein